ncbi:zinc-binding dehydrogenase [Roseicitreum antarcticum]|uniref:NADPH:quinone reductase n=1 Tax=Roseicitreum antarcticum TaxID=564137 RepID=A0A1H2TQS3_9RHOB|nr:zinc-binding dehydrogenase [Roseicitreum antarcticum]SDW46118.1 NADPH:quinone reductase [Roseicitreum antarcticum]
MKALVHDTFGDPKAVLQARDVALPEPRAGELRIKMLLSPIHNHDLWTIRGDYGYKPDLPGAIGGSEAAGIVDAVGDGVDAGLVGQRVVAAGVHGTWAEHFIAPASGVVPLPEQISDKMGAQLISMPFSALSMLDLLKAEPGQWIIQTAANGAVGRVMVVLAAARGINLLNLVRRDAAAAELRAAGIGNVVSTSAHDWQDQARTIIGAGRAVSAIDSVGGEISADLVDLLAPDGELMVFGTATGAPMPLSSGALIMKQITIKGFWGARVSAEMAVDKRVRLITELVTLAAKGALLLDIGGIFALDQGAEAVEASLTPGRAGKVMLKP